MLNSYHILVAIISISALLGYINVRYLRMPFVIGLFFLSSLLSLAIVSVRFWSHAEFLVIQEWISQIDISKYILEYMLGFLLFAGALHTEWREIKKQLKQITIYAIFGVLASTFLIGGLFYVICQFFSMNLPWIYCLLFGALISPTDPISVLGILTKAGVSKRLESTIVGESLFNDGIGVVVFVSILQMLQMPDAQFDLGAFGILFFKEAIGGMVIGLISGYILHRLLSSIDHYETEVLLTLSFVMLIYILCLQVHISGALAMVIMGLFIGNFRFQESTQTDITIDYLDKFWELVDVVLNAILFVVISFVLVVLDFTYAYIFLGIISIFIVLLARTIIIGIPNVLFPNVFGFRTKDTAIIIWGGLRGGLSLAMALSLPAGNPRNLLLIATYFCVVFSILIQGLTISKLARNYHSSISKSTLQS